MQEILHNLFTTVIIFRFILPLYRKNFALSVFGPFVEAANLMKLALSHYRSKVMILDLSELR